MSTLFFSGAAVYHVPRDPAETDEEYWDRAWGFVRADDARSCDALEPRDLWPAMLEGTTEAQRRRGALYSDAPSESTDAPSESTDAR